MSYPKELKEILKEHTVRADVDSIIVDTEGMVKVEQYFKDNPPGASVKELKVPAMEFGVVNGNNRIYPRASLKNIPDVFNYSTTPADDEKILKMVTELSHNQGADPKLLSEHICDIVNGHGHYDAVQIDSVSAEVRINYLKKYLPELFERNNTPEEDLKMLKAYDRWQSDMAFINMLGIHDKYPDIKYDPVTEIAHYISDRYLTKCRAYRLGITVTSNGNILHPRHWSYCPATREVTYMNYKVIDGVMLVNKPAGAEQDTDLAMLYQRVREFCKEKNIRVQFSNELETLDEIASLSTPGSASIMNVIKGRQHGLRRGVIHFLSSEFNGDWYTKGFPLGLVPVPGGLQTLSQEPEDITPTVKGNSRQKIIDNGKHQWPEARTRKGRRNR